MAIELDYIEYATDVLAQLNWVHNTSDIPDTSYTKLLMHFDGADGATVMTCATGQIVSTYGTAQLDTAQKKFGTASLLLDGTSDYVSVPDSNDWNINFATEFAFDCWLRFNDTTGVQTILDQYQDAANYWAFYKDAAHKLSFVAVSNSTTVASYIMSSAWTIGAGTWSAIRLIRRLADIYIYINGTEQTLTETVDIATNEIKFGGELKIGNGINGWVDEVRVTQGASLYGNYTPQEYEYSVIQSFTNTSSTYKIQGDYSLKLRNTYGSLLGANLVGKTFTKTLSTTNLTDYTKINVWTSNANGYLKIGIHDSGGTTTEQNLINGNNIIDISSVTSANKDAIDSIILTYISTPVSTADIYIDNIYAYNSETFQSVIL